MASGNTLFVALPQDNEPPASAYAQLDTRNSVLVLAFDASTQEGAVFRGVLPSNYAGGGLTLDLFWAAASATSGAVRWDVAFERENSGTGNISSDNFGTATAGNTTTAGTSGVVNLTTLTISSANMGTAVAGDPFRVRVRRIAADAADTMTGDAQWVSLHAKET